jgi:anti-sigma-K factor RskA
VSADLHLLTGAYAAGALEEPEQTRFEEHLAACAACRDEVRGLTATTALLAAATAVAPPAGLRGRVLDEVARTRQLPPPAPGNAGGPTSMPWYRRPLAVAAAVLLVVAAALGAATVEALDRAQDAEQRAELITAIATDPDRQVATALVPDGGQSTVIAARGHAILRTTEMAQLPENRVYQLWVIRSTGPESAGLLGRGGELEALIEDMQGALGVGVTVEPAGGSSEPTGPTLFRVLMS